MGHRDCNLPVVTVPGHDFYYITLIFGSSMRQSTVKASTCPTLSSSSALKVKEQVWLESSSPKQKWSGDLQTPA